MKTRIHRTTAAWNITAIMLGIAGFVGMNVDASHAQERSSLFTYMSNADMSDKQVTQLDTYRGDPTTSQIRIIMMDTAHIPTSGPITVDLFEGEGIQLSGIRIVKRTSRNFSMFGETIDGSAVTLVVDGMDVTGTIRTESNLYSVRPLGNGLQALILRNQDAFPPDEPPGFETEMEDRMREREHLHDDADHHDQSSLEDSGSIISVLVAWTPAAEAQAGNIGSLIQLAIEETATFKQ